MKAELLSFFYRAVRRQVINHTYRKQKKENMPHHLEDAVDIGDRWLKELPQWAYTFDIPKGIGVDLYDLHFDSPLTLAAFKDDVSIIDIWMRLGLGGVCLKTIMKDAREGNKKPRLQEVSVDGLDSLINAMGLPGHGVEGKIAEVEGSSIRWHNRPVGFSVGGSSLDEYKFVFDTLNFYLSGKSFPYYFEVNISCPNTPEGQQMGKNPELLRDLLEYMHFRTKAVIGVKLSPDMENTKLLDFVDLIGRFHRTYVNLGNTTFRKCVDVGLPETAISIKGGGLSGPSLYPRTLEMTKLVHPVLPIIATGGVDSAAKVRELLANGASLVGMASAVVKDMYCIPKINYEIAQNL